MHPCTFPGVGLLVPVERVVATLHVPIAGFESSLFEESNHQRVLGQCLLFPGRIGPSDQISV